MKVQGTDVPAIGTTTANEPLNIPEELDLIILTAAQDPTFTLQDRVGGKISAMNAGKALVGFTTFTSAGAVSTAYSVTEYPFFYRFDGRVIGQVTPNTGSLPFFYMPHDAQAPFG